MGSMTRRARLGMLSMAAWSLSMGGGRGSGLGGGFWGVGGGEASGEGVGSRLGVGGGGGGGGGGWGRRVWLGSSWGERRRVACGGRICSGVGVRVSGFGFSVGGVCVGCAVCSGVHAQ